MDQINFNTGFPLDTPNAVLPWNKPLDKVAQMSGGVWHNDRYIWKGVKYLKGLDYLLCSDNGVSQQSPFQSISAYIGLSSEGLWSDQLTLQEYKKTSQHLIKLFGQPTKRETNSEVPDVETLAWQQGKVEVRLDVIEQFAYKCYLTFSFKE